MNCLIYYIFKVKVDKKTKEEEILLFHGMLISSEEALISRNQSWFLFIDGELWELRYGIHYDDISSHVFMRRGEPILVYNLQLTSGGYPIYNCVSFGYLTTIWKMRNT